MTADTAQQDFDTVNPELQRYLNDPLAMDESIDLDALNEGRFELTGRSAAADDKQEHPQPAEASAIDPADNTDADISAQLPVEDAPSDPENEADNAQDEDANDATEAELVAIRQRAVQAEAMLAEIIRENTALKAGAGSQALAADIDEASLASLREDAPEMAEMVEKLIAQNRELTAQAQAREQAAQQTQLEQRISAQVAVEEAIASIPKLAHVRINDPATFGAIARIDTALGAQPVWQDRPLAERFNAALRAYEAAHGTLAQPQGAVPAVSAAPAAPAAAQATPKFTQADVDKQVAAAIAKAQTSGSHVQTLSDISGGEPAAPTERDALFDLSETALTERFMHMSPDQIQAELARLS